jgi:hypothetical protein
LDKLLPMGMYEYRKPHRNVLSISASEPKREHRTGHYVQKRNLCNRAGVDLMQGTEFHIVREKTFNDLNSILFSYLFSCLLNTQR